MKKKFIAVYALIGVLALGSTTLTSCVDDNESASVTAIRDAKAAQLNALANYQNVKAQNEQIVAQAKAAFKNAEAAAKRAQAIKDSLEAEVKKATISKDIEAALTTAEAQLVAQQALLAVAKADLEKVLDVVDMAQKERIQNLLDAADAIMNGGSYDIYKLGNLNGDPNYGWATSIDGSEVTITPEESLIGVDDDNKNVGLKYQLIGKQAERVAAEYDLTDTQLKIADYVRQANEQLAVDKAVLEQYKTFSTADREAALKAYQEGEAKLKSLQTVQESAEAVYDAEAQKIAAANTNIGATEVEKFFALDENKKYLEDGSVGSREHRKGEPITVTYDDGTVSETTPDYTMDGLGHSSYAEITFDEEKLANLVEDAENDVTTAEQALEDAEEAKTEGQKDDAEVDISYNEESYTTYKAAKDARDDAEEAYATSHAESDQMKYESLRNQIQEYENELQEEVDAAQQILDEANEEQARVTALNTLLTGEAFTTYQTVYDAYIAAVDASVEKDVEKMKADHNYQVQSDLNGVLLDVANGYTDWTNEISLLEQEINNAEKWIAAMTDAPEISSEDEITSEGEGYTEAQRQAYIEALDVEIARLEKQIEVMEAQYDSYMQQVEELINSDDTTTPAPETPAEGEETPAA